MSKFYTPQQVAYYFFEKKYSIEKINETVEQMFKKEYPFIHHKYQENEDLFLKETIKYYSFFTYKKEYDKQIREGKDLEHHLKKYEIFIKNFFPNFFLFTRLSLLYDKDYKTIKLRTLLDMYGYKTRYSGIMLKFRDNIYFYHLKTYKKGQKRDINDFKREDMITFKLY